MATTSSGSGGPSGYSSRSLKNLCKRYRFVLWSDNLAAVVSLLLRRATTDRAPLAGALCLGAFPAVPHLWRQGLSAVCHELLVELLRSFLKFFGRHFQVWLGGLLAAHLRLSVPINPPKLQ